MVGPMTTLPDSLSSLNDVGKRRLIRCLPVVLSQLRRAGHFPVVRRRTAFQEGLLAEFLLFANYFQNVSIQRFNRELFFNTSKKKTKKNRIYFSFFFQFFSMNFSLIILEPLRWNSREYSYVHTGPTTYSVVFFVSMQFYTCFLG